MINISELRIGNYIYNKKNYGGEAYIDTVIDLLLKAPLSFAGGEKEYPKINGNFCEHIEPIPLTADLLNNCKNLNDSDVEVMPLGEKLTQTFWLTNEKLIAKIAYVHQLQNWFFAVTGKELYIKGLI